MARPNPESEWITREVPDLQIVDDDLWQAAKVRQAKVKQNRAEDDEGGNRLHDRQRPRYLLSGLTRCGCCGGGYSMISADLVGCSTARNKGTCGNRSNIRRNKLEERVLNALHQRLMDPACSRFLRRVHAGDEPAADGRTGVDRCDAG